MFNRILIAADASEECARALPVAIDIAYQYRAELHIVVVEPVVRAATVMAEVESERLEAEKQNGPVIERAKRLARMKAITLVTHVVTSQELRRRIVELISTYRFNLLVVGAKPQPAILRRFGTVGGWRLAKAAPCAVLLVK